jgi:hypothetical protein
MSQDVILYCGRGGWRGQTRDDMLDSLGEIDATFGWVCSSTDECFHCCAIEIKHGELKACIK